MYVKTHGNVTAGQQKNRAYDWNLNPNTHVFGFGEQHVPGGAARAVHAERVDGGFPKTVIVKKTVEDTKAVQHDHLGSVKNMGQGGFPIASNTIFGIPTHGNEKDGWNAAKCINGTPSERELQPDKDLGTTLRVGCRN